MATATKNERIDIRLTAEIKQKLDRAAALLGETRTGFILKATDRFARRVIRQSQEIRLSNRDRDRFLAALDCTDAKPNAALLQAAERYRAATGG